MCTQYLLDYIYTFHVWSSPVLTWSTHHANKNCCTLCYSFYTSISKLTLSYIRLAYHNYRLNDQGITSINVGKIQNRSIIGDLVDWGWVGGGGGVQLPEKKNEFAQKPPALSI